jgi:hypothetical protein
VTPTPVCRRCGFRVSLSILLAGRRGRLPFIFLMPTNQLLFAEGIPASINQLVAERVLYQVTVA